ncbi:uncharacterized protein HKW66_Vig0107510 [Vigna angularis]|uniref:Uncharacterized protein n=1 Tax=Phaseolus angularis TaxID=3914 RepID=A0A8T0KWS2_PHAAN|nr:uncharacterized protein HKW66_Vig0107510 [Vigna angularis]
MRGPLLLVKECNALDYHLLNGRHIWRKSIQLSLKKKHVHTSSGGSRVFQLGEDEKATVLRSNAVTGVGSTVTAELEAEVDGPADYSIHKTAAGT